MLPVCALCTEFKDRLNLLNIHVPAHNLTETDVAKVKAICGFNKNFVTYHFYCIMTWLEIISIKRNKNSG